MHKNKIFLLFIMFLPFFWGAPVNALSCSDGSNNGICVNRPCELSSGENEISPTTGCDTANPICCSGVSPAPAPTPAPASSTGGLKYTLLEKIPGLASTDGSNLPVYVKAIYSTALAIVVLSALFMLSVGGFMYLTSAGNTSAMGTAKEVIFDSIIGLIIALSAWLLLNVINPDLVNVTISGLSATPTLPGAPAPVTPVPATGQYSNADAVAALQATGISVTSSGNCSNQNNASCTSLEGIPQSTIANIVNLKTISGCSFNVTGGTEVGHASHGSGKPIVDVSEAPCLKAFFQTSKGQGTLTSSARITAICATAANQSVAFNCTYQEPAAHFHLQFNP